MTGAASSRELGFTLIEVLISVALFALIGVAGFTLVESIIGVQRRTDMRLESLADMQRAMHILTADFEQAEERSLAFDGARVSVSRPAGAASARDATISFGLQDGVLVRSVTAPGGPVRNQALITGVQQVAWRFYLPASGWQETPVRSGDDTATPEAVAVDITMRDESGRGGILRRVVTLPRPHRE